MTATIETCYHCGKDFELWPDVGCSVYVEGFYVGDSCPSCCGECK